MAYGDLDNINYKANKYTKSSSSLQVVYDTSEKISLQFGKTEKSGIKEKDKYSNVTLKTQRIIFYLDKEYDNKLVVLGEDKGLIVQLDSNKDMQTLCSKLPVD